MELGPQFDLFQRSMFALIEFHACGHLCVGGLGLFHPWRISQQIQSKLVLIKVNCSLLVPTRITNPTRIPEILPTTKNSVVVVVDCTNSA